MPNWPLGENISLSQIWVNLFSVSFAIFVIIWEEKPTYMQMKQHF